MKKPTVMIIKSSPWKSAHLVRNHPEYSAIFNLVQRYGKKIRFVLVGTSNSPTNMIVLQGDTIAWDIQLAGTISHFKYYLQLMKILFRHSPHVVIVLGGLNALPVIIYSILWRRCNYVCVFAGGVGYHGRKIMGYLLNYLALKILAISLQISRRKILDILALSKFVQKNIEKLAPSLNGRIRLVSYPLSSVYSARQQIVSKYVRPSNEPVILTVAGIGPVKGLDTLIEAASLIEKRFKILVIGSIRDSVYMRQLMKMVSDFNLRDKITFITDFVNNDALASYYESATLFVLPSREEALGVVLLEALYCNLPVIATSVGGIPDVIENGINGILVRPDDPNELANAISLLLDDDALREKIAKNARRILFNRYYKGRITLEEALNESVTHLLAAH